MPHHTPSAIEIDRKLRDDFRRRLRDYGVSAETIDPILSVLFRSFATQIETVYLETSGIRLALLDELISGLALQPRMARPAQTIVRFLTGSADTVVIPEGTGLLGEAQSGERLSFATDASLAVSRARIAAIFVYQDGSLRLLPGHDMPEEFQQARPSLEPVRAALGSGAAVYLAIENLAPEHLTRHGFFFEFGPDAASLERALATEPWCLVGNDGELSSAGVLRPRLDNAGLHKLEWLVPDEQPAGEAREHKEVPPTLPSGFYGSRVFLLPAIRGERMFRCAVPRRFEAILPRLFGRDYANLFAAPRAWLRISFPGHSAPLHAGLGAVYMHAVTASNVECLNQTFDFATQGTNIPIGSKPGVDMFLVSPLSIFGETGAPYLTDQTPSSDPRAGRYKLQHQRLELRPALRPDGTPEAYANVRLWMTNGALGNAIGPGRIQSSLKAPGFSDVRVLNPVSAAGGTNGETVDQALARFRAALLARDRIVTRTDLEAEVRAFDRRILAVETETNLRRTTTGLQRVQQVKLQLDFDAFVEPEAESRILRDELEQKLRERILYDTELVLETRWA